MSGRKLDPKAAALARQNLLMGSQIIKDQKQERIERAQAMFQKGMTVKQICAVTGLATKTICEYVRPLRPEKAKKVIKQRVQARRKKVKQLKLINMQNKEIAAALSTTPEIVANDLRIIEMGYRKERERKLWEPIKSHYHECINGTTDAKFAVRGFDHTIRGARTWGYIQ